MVVDVFMALILVTDDSAFQRKIISSVLEDGGYELVEASNGREALILAGEKKPDLILLDLLMPDMDGFQFMKAAHKKGIETPVVVLTSDIQNTTRDMCLKLGASGFVNKPVEKSKLIPVIDEVLSGRGR
ncbi:response regulator [Methanomicrobium sp. W14]|uniref:response regulator n=1 Tax=Methanomicrobium sp. W14 TaxID=2817839 RepID=UPI0032AFD3EF